MREIKFRGKRVDNSEWVFGDIVHHDGVISYIGQHFYDGAMIMRDLQPDTVGQFTGLLDKNGKEIYEGDILKVHDAYKNFGELFHEFTGKVEFDNASFAINQYDWMKHYRWIDYECEIIGNIYENPELLEVNKE